MAVGSGEIGPCCQETRGTGRLSVTGPGSRFRWSAMSGGRGGRSGGFINPRSAQTRAAMWPGAFRLSSSIRSVRFDPDYARFAEMGVGGL